MRSEGYSSCLSVDDYSRTTGYEAAYERYQQLQCYKGMKNNAVSEIHVHELNQNKKKKEKEKNYSEIGI